MRVPACSAKSHIVIGMPLSTVSQCAACMAFRDRYREKLVPITLGDTQETIVLGVTCLKRILERYMSDKGIPHRKLSGAIGRLRRTLIVDLSAKYEALGLRKGHWEDERAFIRRSDAQDDLRITAQELRLYLQEDIFIRQQEGRRKK